MSKKRIKVRKKASSAKRFSRDVKSISALNLRGAPMRGGFRL